MTASTTTTTTISIRISSDLKDKLDRLAKGTQRSNSFLAARAIETYVDRELEIVEGILRGIEDVKAGRVVPHEQVMAELHAMIDRGKATRSRARSAKGEAPARLVRAIAAGRYQGQVDFLRCRQSGGCGNG